MVYKYVVVVAEFVAYADFAVGIAQVVLRFAALRAVIVGREFIHIGVAGAAQKVFHRFVVHAFGGIDAETGNVFIVCVE